AARDSRAGSALRLGRNRILKVLLIGWSDIGRRRIVPALARNGIAELDVASRRGAAAIPDGFHGRTFDDYQKAIDETDAGIIYVTTTNDSHAALTAAALARGKHVIVDKPMSMQADEAPRLV